MPNTSEKSKTIKFSKKIYKAREIEMAARDYSEYAAIRISDDGEFINVNISGVHGDNADELRGEFCNYVLCMMREV